MKKIRTFGLVLLFVGIGRLYSQTDDASMHTVEDVSYGFIKQAEYKLLMINEVDTTYELIFKNTFISSDNGKINFEKPSFPIRVLVSRSVFKMVGKDQPSLDSLFNSAGIVKSQMIDFRKNGDDTYHCFYICEMMGKPHPGIFDVSLDGDFKVNGSNFKELEQIKHVNVEQYASDKNGFVFCESERSNKGFKEYKFICLDPDFGFKKDFLVNVPTQYKLNKQAGYSFYMDELGQLIIHSHGSIAVYDLATGNVSPMNTGSLQIQGENKILKKDIYTIKTLEKNIWTTFIVHQSNPKVYGYDQFIVMRDSSNSSVGIGSLSKVVYNIADTTRLRFYTENEIKKYKGDSRHTIKGIPEVVIDTVIRKSDGSYFLITRNFLTSVYGYYSFQTSSYGGGYIIREFGPVLLFHFKPDHTLAKMVVLEKQDYGSGAKIQQKESSWKLIGDMLYGCAGAANVGAKEYVHKYNTINMTYTSEAFSSLHNDISIYTTDKGNLMMVGSFIYQTDIGHYFPLIIQPISK